MSYKLGYSGKEVGEAVKNATDYLPLIYGRETVTRTSSQSGNYLSVKLSLPFTPTNNTIVVATVEVNGTPNPFRDFALVLCYVSGSIYATVSKDYYAETNTLPSGTYYINWFVLDKG